MGDYYKIKKILLILIIVLTIIRIFKTSNVFATEAVEVTPTWNDGSYTYQADNNYLTLRQNQIDIQNGFINFAYRCYDLGTAEQKTNIVNTLRDISRYLASSDSNSVYYGGLNTRFIHFSRVLTSVSGVTTYNYCYCVFTGRVVTPSNIVYADATLNDGYKILATPFYQFDLNNNGGRLVRYVYSNTAAVDTVSSGTYKVPCAETGCYSELWVDLFKYVGLITDTSNYNQVLADILEINEQSYTQELYTKQAVQNTYSYLTNDNIEEITSLGISQPQVTEQVDLTDVLDSLEALLTNETYTTKFFTITLPNGRGSTFALSPELLENNLNRVGGQNIVSIIHAVWYIGLYGWYIFSLLGIYGKLLTGDLFHLVKGCSPVTNLVKMSVGTISGGKF